MIIIWRGAGIVVPVLGFASLVGMQLAVDAAGGEGYWTRHAWPLQAAIALTAVVLWWLGRRLNARPPIVHATAAEGIRLREHPPKHSFFYLPMEWWGLGIALALLAGIAYDATKGAA